MQYDTLHLIINTHFKSIHWSYNLYPSGKYKKFYTILKYIYIWQINFFLIFPICVQHSLLLLLKTTIRVTIKFYNAIEIICHITLSIVYIHNFYTLCNIIK